MGIFNKPGFNPFSVFGSGPKLHRVTLERITAETAKEICGQFALHESARQLLTETINPVEYFKLLVNNKFYGEAVRLLAYGLPAREAVWWGCQCARTDPVLTEHPAAAEAMHAAENWVADPTDCHQETARLAAQKPGFEMPEAVAAWLVLAAAASKGCLCAPGEGEEMPKDHTLTGHGVSGAILLGASREEKVFKRRISEFLDLGVQVADGPGAEAYFSRDDPSPPGKEEVE